ncbi:MAG: VOC family protein [Acidimicrobiales bacterium]|jgi:2,3-dihydroxybiphenyl 1,2-dioxygenase
MTIVALGYIGIRSEQLEAWGGFAEKLLGMQVVDQTKRQLTFRMDDRRQRLVVSDEPGNSLAFLGWEVAERGDLDQYAARLEQAGHRVEIGSASLAARRFVTDLIVTEDPGGNRVEIVWRPEVTSDSFRPGRPISGFETGPLGMGHAVLHTSNIGAQLSFYRDVLDFGLTDYGLTPYPLYFLHVNNRHHSFALIGSGEQGLHHFMVEFQHLDDVGQGFDLAQLEPDRVAYTLGRHANDYMTSYYSNSPSGFFVESGWGGVLIDRDTWEAHETTDGPSLWGHERLYLPEEPRARMRDMRLDAAERGRRAPALIDCPWLYGGAAQSNRRSPL